MPEAPQNYMLNRSTAAPWSVAALRSARVPVSATRSIRPIACSSGADPSTLPKDREIRTAASWRVWSCSPDLRVSVRVRGRLQSVAVGEGSQEGVNGGLVHERQVFGTVQQDADREGRLGAGPSCGSLSSRPCCAAPSRRCWSGSGYGTGSSPSWLLPLASPSAPSHWRLCRNL